MVLNMKRKYTCILFFALLVRVLYSQSGTTSLNDLVQNFAAEYRALDIPWVDFDYRNYLREIPPVAEIEKREVFFKKYKQALRAFDPAKLQADEKVTLAHLRYQLDLHLGRCALEKQVKSENEFAISNEGLGNVPHGKALYSFFIRYATGVDISPDAVYAYGMSEIGKIHREINRIRARAGFQNDSVGWINYLNNRDFFLTERDSVVAGYEKIKMRVLAHLGAMYEQTLLQVPEIDFMTWPDAGP